MQILLALHHCHHPNGHSKSGGAGGAGSPIEGKEKRVQILHRDLKPDNGVHIVPFSNCRIDRCSVFLDESNTVKLGDFGLSKALVQTGFANTYVGVR